MKHYFIIFFFVIFSCYHSSAQISAQQAIYDIAKNYYRANPFENKFNSFLNHLMNDPALLNKTIHKKTDTTLFFLEGTYSSHSPFFFKADKTKIILAENEEVKNVENDSSLYLQTTFFYQIIAYAPAGEEGIKDVKEEFEKLCRRNNKKFDGNNYKELRTDEKQGGEIRNYSSDYPGFFPLTIAWATSKEHNDNILALTIRFMVFENQAYLPITADDF
jgi:hypothetical protein